MRKRKPLKELDKQVLELMLLDRFLRRTPQEIADSPLFRPKASVRKVAESCSKLHRYGFLDKESGKLLSNTRFGIAHGQYNEIAQIIQS